jgi:hypothetical protein
MFGFSRGLPRVAYRTAAFAAILLFASAAITPRTRCRRRPQHLSNLRDFTTFAIGAMKQLWTLFSLLQNRAI